MGTPAEKGRGFMIRRLTPERELESRTQSFARLTTPGQIFEVSGKRFFVLVAREGEQLEAIELSRENCRKLIGGEVCRRSTLNFADLGGLFLHERVEGVRH